MTNLQFYETLNDKQQAYIDKYAREYNLSIDEAMEAIEDEYDCREGIAAWREFVDSGEKGIPWEELVAEFKRKNLVMMKKLHRGRSSLKVLK